MLFDLVAKKYLTQDSEDLSQNTIKTYYWNLKKLRDFCPELECENVSETFVRQYRFFLQQRGDKPATVVKALSVFRNYCIKMLADGYLEKNPFEKIKIGRVYSQRGFLTTKELKLLYWNFLDDDSCLTDSEREVVRVFLFSCFTGLRYGDLRSLNSKEIFDWKIRKQTHKTGEAVYIPIPIQARRLLPMPLEVGQVFHVVENSHFNRTLRTAAKKLGYTKYIHCHLARHTFATTCITLGIPLAATSKLLGHRNLNTTLIYAKYIDVYLDKEMKKFNKLK